MTEITFLQGLFLLLFPFLASVAFTLFLRSLDNKNNIADKIRSQRAALQDSSDEIESIKNKMQYLVREMETVVQEKAEEIYQDVNRRSGQFQDSLLEQSGRIDKTILNLREESKKKLAEETESLIQDTINRVNAIFSRIDEFQNQIAKSELTKVKDIEDIRQIAESTQDKMNNFQSLINERADLAGRVVEEKLTIYSQKFQGKLKLLFDQSNFALVQSSKEMQKEINIIKQEVLNAQKSAMKNEDEYIKELANRKVHFENNFEKMMDSTKSSIDLKLEKHKTAVYEISSQIEKLEIKMEDKLESSMKHLLERVSLYEKKLQDRFESTETEANQIRDSWLKNLNIELGTSKDEIRKMEESISFRKDEILNETKRKVESLYHYVEKVKEDYVLSQNGLIQNYESKKDEYNSFTKHIDEKIAEVNGRIQQKAIDSQEYINTIKIQIEQEGKRAILSVHEEANLQKGNLDSAINSSALRLAEIDNDWNKRFDSYKEMFETERMKVLSKVNAVQLDSENLLSKFQFEFDNFKSILEGIYHNYKDGLTDKNEMVLDDISSKSKRLQEEMDSQIQKSIRSFEQIYQKQESLLGDYSNNLLVSLNDKLLSAKQNAEFVLDEIESSSKNFMNKQEEKVGKFNAILNDRISAELTRLIDKGELQLGALENKIANYIRDTKSNIEEILVNSKEDSQKRIEEFHHQTLRSIKEIELTNEDFLESSRKDFAKSKEELLRLKSGIELEADKVNDLKVSVYNLVAEESTKIQLQKAKSEKLALDIQLGFQNLDLISNRMSEMKDKINLLSTVESKINFIQEFNSEFDQNYSKLSQIDEKVHFINESVLKNEKLSLDTSKTIEKIHNEILIVEERGKDITRFVASVESKLALFQSKNQEIKSIESKFDKVEGLMMDLSTKHKQISTLQTRVESLRDETEGMKSQFEKMIEEADNKYEKFVSMADMMPPKNSKLNKAKDLETNGKKRKMV